jgi:hypothetical protein
MSRNSTIESFDATVLLRDTLATAERVISFYEDCLGILVAQRESLEKENARLQALIETHLNDLAPVRPSEGTLWVCPSQLKN